MRDDLKERFLVGIYKDGDQKEFSISFFDKNNRDVVRIEAEKSAWDLLYASSDIIKELSRINEGDIKAEDIHYTLTKLKIRDITEDMNNPKV
jgi:hypothetical protein